MAYGISVFPFADSATEYASWLREAGIPVPPPARELPTAADLRDAMVSQGCAGPFWPEASSWFYFASEDAFEGDSTLVEGIDVWIGGASGESMFSSRRPEARSIGLETGPIVWRCTRSIVPTQARRFSSSTRWHGDMARRSCSRMAPRRLCSSIPQPLRETYARLGDDE